FRKCGCGRDRHLEHREMWSTLRRIHSDVGQMWATPSVAMCSINKRHEILRKQFARLRIALTCHAAFNEAIQSMVEDFRAAIRKVAVASFGDGLRPRLRGRHLCTPALAR